MDAIGRAALSLDGLSVGDAFGEQFFVPPDEVARRVSERALPAAPWAYTDDTEMALSVVAMLRERGTVDQDRLAALFAERMSSSRDYGKGTHAILSGVKDGLDWRHINRTGLGGKGSVGNGAAMRVAPLGAFFADRPIAVVCEQARLSAEVTHVHVEGIAGAIAVAAAAALAWRERANAGPLGHAWIAAVRDAIPRGYTRDAVSGALNVPAGAAIGEAAEALGNGSHVSAPDTVPLCIWILAHAAGGFEQALWRTVSALGDRDTTCAIVGGVLALKLGGPGIPPNWRAAREALPQ